MLSQFQAAIDGLKSIKMTKTKYQVCEWHIMKQSGRFVLVLISGLLLVACVATNPPEFSSGHLKAVSSVPIPEIEKIPQAIIQAPALKPPKPVPAVETYTVVVNGVPVRDLLFELARDAKVNVDIHPDIQGTVTLNAIDQTFQQIMDRIARQIDLRYQLHGPNLLVSPDTPYWRNYPIDYVNMSRDSVSEVSVATQIATTGGSVGENSGGSGSNSKGGNVSLTKLTNAGNNHFWEMIETNIQAILGISASDSSTSEGNDEGKIKPLVISNPMSGLLSVRATKRDHQQVQGFLDKVMNSALRQVLVEMTIVEVELSDRYQAGVDWKSLATGTGLSLFSNLIGANLVRDTPPVFSLKYTHTKSSGRTISSTLRMLETFGNVKVLSSPKVMTLNNQTALLKVVDEKVYFTVDHETIVGTNGTSDRDIFTSKLHTIPVGLVMSVTPQIASDDNVTLNIRPTISRITGYATDPVPKLQGKDFNNLVPEIQIRELESLLQVANGQMVVMGGLMQNKISKDKDGVPGISEVSGIGDLFSYRNEKFTKTELIIFLRPTVVKGAGLNFDLKSYSEYLPDADSWAAEQGKPPKQQSGGAL